MSLSITEQQSLQIPPVTRSQIQNKVSMGLTSNMPLPITTDPLNTMTHREMVQKMTVSFVIVPFDTVPFIYNLKMQALIKVGITTLICWLLKINRFIAQHC